jgi:phospholipid-binding lipoprotein MlaA
MKRYIWVFLVLAAMFAGCAAPQQTPQAELNEPAPADLNERAEAGDDDFDMLEDEIDLQMVDVPDPIEPVNRLMFGFNDVLYFWVISPCAGTCKAILPETVRLAISNFFRNLTTPVRLANCLLQGKGKEACTEVDRFLINTTAGVLGFGDPAKDRFGMEPADEDLGQTLAHFGLANGLYLVLPFFGPSTLRDAAGLAGDQFLNPVRYVKPEENSIAISATKGANESTFHIGEYESFKEAAVDPYVAMRQAYIQYRNEKIKE